MFNKVLIANRGEIACRVMRTLKEAGIKSVAVYSEVDRHALHTRMADEAWFIGPAQVSESYLRSEKIIEVALESGAEAIHPGYGFLSENASFAEACEKAGIVFIGPPADAIRAMGLKDAAKTIMSNAGVPVVPGYHGDNQDEASLETEAEKIGYPVLIKAVAGGGGKGMRLVGEREQFEAALAGAKREAKNNFGEDRVLIEKFIDKPRHIEIQVFADSHGNAVYLFERDCSLQRRHQKVIEEAPAPGMSEELREEMGAAAVKAAKAIGYQGAGTVEFIVDGSGGLKPGGFWFMEMNTRLQVEHPVTEMITGQDLVLWQLKVAAGQPLPALQSELSISGHAVEARIYAEDPEIDFLPSTGKLNVLAFPSADEGVRVDSGVQQGDSITSYYDPMIAKLIVHGRSRNEAISKLSIALDEVKVDGLASNASFLGALSRNLEFLSGRFDTSLIERSMNSLVQPDQAPSFEVIAAASLLRLRLGSNLIENDPWNVIRSFRLWGGAEETIVISTGNHDFRTTILSGADEHLVKTNDFEIICREMEVTDELIVFESGGRLNKYSYATTSDGVAVFSEGRTWKFHFRGALEDSLDDTETNAEITASLPGRVTAMYLSANALVTKGDKLLTLEAMKMEHTLTALQDGTVVEIYVEVGDQVDAGQILMRMEPTELSE